MHKQNDEEKLTKSVSPLIKEFVDDVWPKIDIKIETSPVAVQNRSRKNQEGQKEKKSKLNLISRTSINDIQVEELEHVFSVSHSPFSEQQFVSPGKIIHHRSDSSKNGKSSIKSNSSESENTSDSESDSVQSNSESENDTIKKSIYNKQSSLRQSSTLLVDSKETDRSSKSDINLSTGLKVQHQHSQQEDRS